MSDIIGIQDVILNYIQLHDWEDYKEYSRILSEEFLKSKFISELEIYQIIEDISHPFFIFNKVKKKLFIKYFPYSEILYKISALYTSYSITPKELPRLLFEDVFEECKSVDINDAKLFLDKLDIKERIIQDELRISLREKGASHISVRKSDTALEVADIEDFTLEIGGIEYSMTAVVKGYRSVSKKTITLKDISHQILKANDTNPDYILLIVAKPLTDGVMTRLVKYGDDIGNRNLIILADPLELARYLKVRRLF